MEPEWTISFKIRAPKYAILHTLRILNVWVGVKIAAVSDDNEEISVENPPHMVGGLTPEQIKDWARAGRHPK